MELFGKHESLFYSNKNTFEQYFIGTKIHSNNPLSE